MITIIPSLDGTTEYLNGHKMDGVISMLHDHHRRCLCGRMRGQCLC
jgi:hypothetical protein